MIILAECTIKMNRSKLEDFKAKLSSIYPINYLEILACHLTPPKKSFRLTNTETKVDILNSLQAEGFEISSEFIPNSFVVNGDADKLGISHSTVHLEEKIYIQELSSMLPPYLAKVNSTSTKLQILDLCAAPGSKAGQTAQLFDFQSKIFVNEPNRNRFFKMRELLGKFPEGNFEYLSYDGVMLPYKRPEFLNYFDIVIVDAPCSNEGSLDLNSAESLKYWTEKEAKRISKLQKGLVNAGLKMLKPGGVLIYSTCTYSVEENEGVVNWALEKWLDQVDVIDIKLPLKNIQDGILTYKNKRFDPNLTKTKRIIPDGAWKGFYLSVLKKK